MKKYKRFLKKLFASNLFQVSVIFVFLVVLNLFLYKIFSRRALSFGCFDDCGNYVVGYFMLHGKTLYSEIFFNHIMGMAWLSFFIQKFSPSINIFELVLRHRQVIMVAAFAFDLLIIKRFKWAGFLFVLFYETSKFYVFGDRFLGESLVVYAAVYLFGLVYMRLKGKTFSYVDFIAAGIFTWLIIFMREPYIPLALVLYVVFLWGKFTKQKVASLVIFFILILIVAVNTNISDFIFNDLTVNLSTSIRSEANSTKVLGPGFFQIILYPLFVFLYGKMNVFRVFEIAISASFIVGILYKAFFERKIKTALILVALLAFSSIRVTPPGTVYYEAYHTMVWFGLFLFITLLLSFDIWIQKKILSCVLLGIVAIGWGIAVFSPSSYIYDKLDTQEQLITNFGTVMNIGNVVNHLSDPSDTLFLDGADDMIYWIAKRYSPYPYSLYTSVMPQIPVYRDARLTMFKKSPPVFYYDYCSKDAPLNSSLPEFVKVYYEQLSDNGKPSCLYVLKSKIPKITKRQWEQAQEGFYQLPASP